MRRTRPISFWLVLLLLGQLSLRAVIGGAALMIAPSGTLVGVPLGPLANTPFHDFVLPGLVLFLVFGLGSALVCYGLYANRRWAWPGVITVALALLVWISVEVMLGFTRPTVYVNIGTAIGLIGIAIYPTVRRHLLGQ